MPRGLLQLKPVAVGGGLGAAGHGGTVEQVNEQYSGWQVGSPDSFWFTSTTNHKGTLEGQRVSSLAVSHVIRVLCGPSAGRLPSAKHSFSRGAGFPGHHKAVEHEVRLLTAAANDKRGQAENLRTRLAATAERPKSVKGKAMTSYIAEKTKALKKMVQKVTDEAAFFERQALSAQRFLTEDTSTAETQVIPPSPADSLDAVLASASQEHGSDSLLSPSPRPATICETDTLPSVSPNTQPCQQSEASSRLEAHGGSNTPVDSAPARWKGKGVQNADSPAATTPGNPRRSQAHSQPRHQTRTASAQRSPAATTQTKTKPKSTRAKTKPKGRL